MDTLPGLLVGAGRTPTMSRSMVEAAGIRSASRRTEPVVAVRNSQSGPVGIRKRTEHLKPPRRHKAPVFGACSRRHRATAAAVVEYFCRKLGPPFLAPGASEHPESRVTTTNMRRVAMAVRGKLTDLEQRRPLRDGCPSRAVTLAVVLAALVDCSGQNTTNIPPQGTGDMGLKGAVPPVEVASQPHMLKLDFSCFPDGSMAGCDVSFSSNIFPKMKSTGAWQCASASGCHGAGTAPIMNDNSASDTYNALINYQLGNLPTGLQYVIPCVDDPTQSAITCNLIPAGFCGQRMPLRTRAAIEDVSSDDLTNVIEKWLSCGAPNN